MNGADISSLMEAFAFQIPGYGLDHQTGAIADIFIALDFIENVGVPDPYAYPEFVSIVNFVKNYLTNYPNESDFWEVLNRNLVTTLLTETIPTTFGVEYELEKVVDSLSVAIDVKPGSSLVNYPRESFVIGSPRPEGINFREAFSFEIPDYGLDHQGGAIVDIFLDLDFKEDIGVEDPYAYPEFVSIVNFVKSYLTNYPNETDFWEVLNRNLVQTLLTEKIPTPFEVEYELDKVVDSLAVRIEVESGSSLVNYDRASSVKGSPHEAGIEFEEGFSFEISDYGLDHQGGAIVDIGIELDFIEDVAVSDPYAYPEFVSIVNFVKDYLVNYPNETDFWEILNKNLVTALLTETIPTTFGVEYHLSDVVDSLTVDIDVEAGSSLVNYNRSSEVTGSPESGSIDLDESFHFEISDYGLDHQGGAIVDIDVDMYFKEGVGDQNPFAYPEFVSIVNYIKNYLVNYPNENDFWEILNKNLSTALMTDVIPTTFGVEYHLSDVVETLNVDIQVSPGSSLVNYPRVSSVSLSVEPAPRLTNVGAGTFTITSPDGANPNLKLRVLESKVGVVRDLCVFTVDDETGQIDGILPGEKGYTRAALNRSKAGISVLSKQPTELISGEMSRSMAFEDGDLLRFMLIKKNSLDDLIRGRVKDGSILFSNQKNLSINETVSGYSLDWSLSKGKRSAAKNLIIEIEASNQGPPLGAELQDQPETEVIDLRGFAPETEVMANFEVTRQSQTESFVGFYQIDGIEGAVIDPITFLPLLPGDPLYSKAAMKNRAPEIGLQVADQSRESINSVLQGGALWAPFIIANGTPDQLLDESSENDPLVYFPFINANPGRLDRIRIGGDNNFYFEDRRGGGPFDFDDVTVTATLMPPA